MSVEAVTEETFDEKTKDGLVLVDFWATWCGPCKFMAPILDKFDNAHDEIVVSKVDVDENQRLALEYKVSAIPTMILMRDGIEIDRYVGGMPLVALEKKVSDTLGAQEKA